MQIYITTTDTVTDTDTEIQIYVYACSMDFTLGLVTGMYAIVAVIVLYVVYVIEVKLGMPSMLQLDNNSIHSLTHFLHTHHMPPLATLATRAATFHFSIVHRRFVFLTIIVLTIRLAVVFLDQTVMLPPFHACFQICLPLSTASTTIITTIIIVIATTTTMS